MPQRAIGGVLRKLNEARTRASGLPSDLSARLGDVVTRMQQLPGMPLEQRRDSAREQRDDLRGIQAVIDELIHSGALVFIDSSSMPDIESVVKEAIDALEKVADGLDINL